MEKKINGKSILFKQFWHNGCWRNQRQLNISEQELLLAKEQGFMFDYPQAISHEEYLNKLNEMLLLINKEDVANAFLYSLSTRKLEYRSALGSYWYAISMPKHDFRGCDEKNSSCSICNWSSWEDNPDLYAKNKGYNIYNFERFKWGGIRFCSASYALFDLEQFIKLEKVKHSIEDEHILLEILKCVNELFPRNKAGALQKVISSKKILKSNKQEINVILDILGICGILSSDAHPCYYDKFATLSDRNSPELTNDYCYPLNWWRAIDGINYECYKRVFGKSLDM